MTIDQRLAGGYRTLPDIYIYSCPLFWFSQTLRSMKRTGSRWIAWAISQVQQSELDLHQVISAWLKRATEINSPHQSRMLSVYSRLWLARALTGLAPTLEYTLCFSLELWSVKSNQPSTSGQRLKHLISTKPTFLHLPSSGLGVRKIEI